MNMNQRETARIEFAGKAMQGLASNAVYMEAIQNYLKKHGRRDLEKLVAEDSVKLADALIAELERTEVRHD